MAAPRQHYRARLVVLPFGPAAELLLQGMEPDGAPPRCGLADVGSLRDTDMLVVLTGDLSAIPAEALTAPVASARDRGLLVAAVVTGDAMRDRSGPARAGLTALRESVDMVVQLGADADAAHLLAVLQGGGAGTGARGR